MTDRFLRFFPSFPKMVSSKTKGGTTMKRNCLPASLIFLGAFALWTLLLCFVDVQAVGPNGSSVGFAELNRFLHALTGVHWILYTVTDWLGLIPLLFIMGFGLLGLWQWIRRKHLLRVDRSILVLGIFYLVVIAFYLFFETVVINYRPVLVNGYLEASYPSSTTMLALCVMPTAMLQLRGRIQNPVFNRFVLFVIGIFTAFMVIGRLLSGVHWLSDIIGGILLSTGLVMLYHAFAGKK